MGGPVLVLVARAPWQRGSAAKRPLRPRIATQHGVGREETRMPRVHVGARLESRTARVSVATVTVVAVASGRAAVAAEANIRGKRLGYLKMLAAVRH